MLVARFRLAAPLSSSGVIVASMGQPNADAGQGCFTAQSPGASTRRRHVQPECPPDVCMAILNPPQRLRWSVPGSKPKGVLSAEELQEADQELRVVQSRVCPGSHPKVQSTVTLSMTRLRTAGA